MTGRDRLLAILNSRPADRLAWTTLVDATTRSAMPADLQTCPTLDVYRRLCCDFASFGNYGLTPEESVKSPCRLVMPQVEEQSVQLEDGTVVSERRSPWGTLRAECKNGHPTKYPVQTPDDVTVLTEMWLSSRCEEDEGTEQTYRRFEEAAGDDALYVAAVEGSPVQQLIQYEAGVESFYYLLNDARERVERLLDAMHQRRSEEMRICARRMPCEAIILVENTSSTLISPRVYRDLSLPQLRDYARILHDHGKRAILHMCGLLNDLLDDIAETNLDAINGLTPPAFGDTEFGDVLDRYVEDFVIWGGVFLGEVLHKADVIYDEIAAVLERIYTPRLRKANFLLWIVVDGIPTSLDRFCMIGDWMDKHGAK